MNYKLTGGIGFVYSFDTLENCMKRINEWFERGLISETECMAFIIQLFHQIPEGEYNEIINKLSS